jgi:hypothetical protein
MNALAKIAESLGKRQLPSAHPAAVKPRSPKTGDKPKKVRTFFVITPDSTHVELSRPISTYIELYRAISNKSFFARKWFEFRPFPLPRPRFSFLLSVFPPRPSTAIHGQIFLEYGKSQFQLFSISGFQRFSFSSCGPFPALPLSAFRVRRPSFRPAFQRDSKLFKAKVLEVIWTARAHLFAVHVWAVFRSPLSRFPLFREVIAL